MSEQSDNLERVKDSIGPIVYRFVYERAKDGKNEFLINELKEYVTKAFPLCAPASPDRILRQLRLDGEVDYKVINRRASRYQLLRVGPLLTTAV